MTKEDELLAKYLDDNLNAAEQLELGMWLKAAPENVEALVKMVFLHDQLRTEMQLGAEENSFSTVETIVENKHLSQKAFGAFYFKMGIAILFAVIGVSWYFTDKSNASATSELTRLIEIQEESQDRIYHLTVEENVTPVRGERKTAEDSRPPKPPLDQATIYIRKGNQFVLKHELPDHKQIITGSDGQMSWSIKPDGPVKTSRDINQFNRDLPGHEHQISLFNIREGLEELRKSYHVQMLPIEEHDDDELKSSPTRLMVAVKKRGNRGPQRVEITYEVASGLIHQLRFIGMPYGPELLNVRVSLVEERQLEPDFFHHTFHHAPDRQVREE